MNLTIDFLEKWLKENGDRFIESHVWDSYYLDIESLIDKLKEDLKRGKVST
jgi:hypothetical protein